MSNQTIIIQKGGVDVLSGTGIQMYMEDALSVRASSQWDAPFQSIQEGASDLANAINTFGSLIGAFRGEESEDASLINPSKWNLSFQTKYATFQVWKYSEPIAFNISVTFFLGMADIYDVKKEVIIPVSRLMKLVLPTESTKDKTIFERLTKLIAPGPSMDDLVSAVFEGDAIQKVDFGSKESFITVRMGKFLRLEDCFISSVEPTFSETLTDDGYPVSASVQIGISTLTVATTNMIDSMLGIQQKGGTETVRGHT